ncbi:MAG: hypothetical protein HC933_04000 [Pleurocapsa sp. SU_196_0]|nr:hypothetical protein [Pleurocapsa sp. SU_196_0]
MKKTLKAVAVLVLSATLIGSSLALADPSPTNGGGPFKPCSNCRTTGNSGGK